MESLTVNTEIAGLIAASVLSLWIVIATGCMIAFLVAYRGEGFSEPFAFKEMVYDYARHPIARCFYCLTVMIGSYCLLSVILNTPGAS